MAKKVLIISTNIRPNSNSEILANAFADGARTSGNEVELISLKNKTIDFCKGCFACQKLGHCVIKDDANAITEKMLNADVIVWATPIYYYEMSGQMKTMIDRANPLFTLDYRFRDVYLLTTAAEDEAYVDEGALKGV
ncbi:MAG: flavodoxin family protein, partial [Ruminococcus sp.]|nr:flavodoxin family protein [Ruminococcus sp.]